MITAATVKLRPGATLAWVGVALAVALLLSACANRGGYYKDDGPPDRHPVDIDSIPEPVPREEPRSRTGNDPYVALGQHYVPMREANGYREKGTASWYGKRFHGKRTSSGEKYDMYKMTAAHRTLPLPSYVRVTNLDNGESIIVRVNDRGPFLHDRLIDLSYAAAHRLDIVASGTGRVRVETVTGAGSRNVSARASSGSSAGAPVREVSASEEQVAASEERYYVQFGAFSKSANARNLVRKLQQNGIGFAHIRQGNDGYFRVRSGPFSSSQSAEQILLRGADLGLSTTIVMEELRP